MFPSLTYLASEGLSITFCSIALTAANYRRLEEDTLSIYGIVRHR
jgi:hypothetical protein